MGPLTLWDRIWPWLRHPLSSAATTIAFRYVDNHPQLEIHLVRPVQSCTCQPAEGCSSCQSIIGTRRLLIAWQWNPADKADHE
jgi:hypothetical protein